VELKDVLTTPRTDRQIFDREPIEITLAGKVYEIKPTTKTRSKEFRAALSKHRDFIRRAIELFRLASSHEATVTAEEIADVLILGYTEKLDEAYELVYIYCPNIEVDRERLDDRDTGATEEEWQIALWSILKVTLGPFARALGLNNGEKSGPLEKLWRLGVEYQKQQQNGSSNNGSTNGIKNGEKLSDTPDSPQNGTNSHAKSTSS